MNRQIEAIGKNIEEAINNGLKELQISRDKVDVEIIEEGSKGLFGFIGSKEAKVKITVKNDYSYIAKNFLNDILNNMNIKADIHIEEKKDTLNINLKGSNMGLLIGYRGETLDSLQYLVSLVVNKKNNASDYIKVVLDTENYRQKREETLIKLANKLALRAKTMNKSVILEPMNPYERRIIHAALQNNPHVETHSIGDEPYRKVIIDIRR